MDTRRTRSSTKSKKYEFRELPDDYKEKKEKRRSKKRKRKRKIKKYKTKKKRRKLKNNTVMINLDLSHLSCTILENFDPNNLSPDDILQINKFINMVHRSVSEKIIINCQIQNQLLKMLQEFRLPSPDSVSDYNIMKNLLCSISNLFDEIQNSTVHRSQRTNYQTGWSDEEFNYKILIKNLIEAKKEECEGNRLYIQCITKLFLKQESSQVGYCGNGNSLIQKIIVKGNNRNNFKVLKKLVQQIFDTFVVSFNCSRFVLSQNCIHFFQVILNNSEKDGCLREIIPDVVNCKFSYQHLQFLLCILHKKLKFFFIKFILKNVYYIDEEYTIKKVVTLFLNKIVFKNENQQSVEKFLVLVKFALKDLMEKKKKLHLVRKNEYKKLMEIEIEKFKINMKKDLNWNFGNIEKIINSLTNVF